MVRQRLDVQLNVARQELEALKVGILLKTFSLNFGILALQDAISNCPDCVNFCGNSGDFKRSGGGDELTGDARIRELELELAQTKLAHVEAECRNQVLGKIIHWEPAK